MAIEKTALNEDKIVTPKVVTQSITMNGTTVTHVSQQVIDESDGIPTGRGLIPWMEDVEDEVDQRLTDFENNTEFAFTHPATHSADIITESATRKWLTAAERIKLAGIATGANYYVHPATHSADMIAETTTYRWLRSDERTKLAGVAENANNYIHPEKHPVSILENFLDVNGFVRSEFIENLTVQRINVRHTLLSGFRYVRPDQFSTNDYADAPLLETNVVVGTNQYVVRITPTVANPLVATMANGFDENGNKDSLIRVTSMIQTPSLDTYGFAPETIVWVILKNDGTLYFTSTEPLLNTSNFIPTITDGIGILRGTVSAANNFLEEIVVLQPGKYQKIETDYIPYDTTVIHYPNRFFTDKIFIQLLRQKEGETNWTVVDNIAPVNTNAYFVDVFVNNYFITLNFTGYITQLMPQAKFRINMFRMY